MKIETVVKIMLNVDGEHELKSFQGRLSNKARAAIVDQFAYRADGTPRTLPIIFTETISFLSNTIYR